MRRAAHSRFFGSVIKALEFAINSQDSYFRYFACVASAALIFSKMSGIRRVPSLTWLTKRR